MGKKAKEYASGDFIFAKVKGYPAWPARVQRLNGKKYLVYFYGTGETANLPPNQIFDYVENKDKFLTKTVKRKDFNDGVKQIEEDFVNKVPLEDIIGVPVEMPMDTSADDTMDDTADDSAMDTTAADTTVADTTTTGDETNTTAQNDAVVEDSDDGALVIDEGNKKGKKGVAKTPIKEPPKPAKEAKTPRGRPKKDDDKEEDKKEEEEIVSRSGRKIRPKRFVDEQTEENATLPTSAAKKKRGASPAAEKDKSKAAEPIIPEKKQYNPITQSQLEDLKEPLTAEDAKKDNILIAGLPNGQYVGIKLFQSRPSSFKNDAAKLQWEKQAASNAITLKSQLEKGHIGVASLSGQLETDLNLTDEEKASLDKEKEIEEKKSRVQFLKTEMKLIELDAKIKSCLSLEKADTDLCLKLLDELKELEVKPLMLFKHASSLETVKRMRAYVGNTPSWELSEADAVTFSKQAGLIRKKADSVYQQLKELFVVPDGVAFWEYFSERVTQFNKCTAKLTPDERLEMVHEPLEMSVPTSHNMKAAIDAANEDTAPEPEEPILKPKRTPAKNKKAEKATNSSTTKPLKRQSSRNKQTESEENNKTTDDKDAADENPAEPTDTPAEIPKEGKDSDKEANNEDKMVESSKIDEESSKTTEKTNTEKEAEESKTENKKGPENGDVVAVDDEENNSKDSDEKKIEKEHKGVEKDKKETAKEKKETLKEKRGAEKKERDSEKKDRETEKKDRETEKKDRETEKKDRETEKKDRETEKKDRETEKKDREAEKKDREAEKKDREAEKKEKEIEKKEREAEKKEREAEKKEREAEKKEKVAEKKKEADKKEAEKKEKGAEKKEKESEKKEKGAEKKDKEAEKKEKEGEKKEKEAEKKEKEAEKKDREAEKREKDGDKEDSGEPRAKRGRGENKKTETPTPKSPLAKRKSSRT